MTSDSASCINSKSLYLLPYSHKFRLYDQAVHHQANFYKNTGMLKFKHNLTLCQSKWRRCLNTYNSVLTLFAASLFSCVTHLIKFTKLQFQYLPLLCNYSLRTILSAINVFSFGRCLVLFVTASNIYLAGKRGGAVG